MFGRKDFTAKERREDRKSRKDNRERRGLPRNKR